MKVLKFFIASPSSFWLIVMSALMSAALWSITPFLTYHFVKYKGIDIKLTALLIGLAVALQFAGSVVGAVTAEKFGLKKTMIFALFIRTTGYLLLLTNISSIMFAGVFFISGGALFYMPAARAYLAYRAKTPQEQIFSFSLHNSGIKLGMIVGPLLSAPFINESPGGVFLVSAIAFALVLVFHIIFLEHNKSINRSALRLFAKFYIYLKSKPLRKVLLFYMFLYLIFNAYQNFMAISIGIKFGLKYFAYGLVIYSLTLIFGGPMMSAKIAAYNIRVITVTGFLLVATGLALISTMILPIVYFGIFFFAVGEMMVSLKHESTASFILHRSVASAVSLWRLAAGLGILINGLFAGSLFHYFEIQGHLNLFWLSIAGIAVLVSGLSFLMYKNFKNYTY